MTDTVQSSYSDRQTAAWLRGLLAIAWADGDFDEEEKKVITALTQDDDRFDLATLEPISPEDLAAVLGADETIAQNFLRTAVMVALADGIYTTGEDELLHQFCVALNQQVDAIDSLRHTLEDIRESDETEVTSGAATPLHPPQTQGGANIKVLAPVREWLDGLEMHDPKVARFLCKMIPSQCPFERDVKLFGRKIVRIPPMCKLNPLYEQLVGLRFRALSYLADKCGEDVTPYV
ncbi:MAG: Mo-dependent nitrogenase C-terminal domain-containing protein [Cyanobacteriota bacterium]|nr:Mo-dependent nitrogenase C-terminal domain-containing protein [Cyanobacteriota bacterium]